MRVPLGIRAASVDDAAAVAALLHVLGYPCSEADARARIEAVREDARQVILLADASSGVAGLLALDFMYYLPLGRTTCRITALVVNPEQRGHGIGSGLVREAERRARIANAARIEVTSAAQRDRAHGFYSGLGYREAAHRFVKSLGDA